MSRDVTSDFGGDLRKARGDSTFNSMIGREFEHPQHSIRTLLGPPISSLRRSSLTHRDEEDHDEVGAFDYKRQPGSDITRVASEILSLAENTSEHNIEHLNEDHDIITHRDQAGGWPDKDITDSNIDDRYVDFIFCCNPAIPRSTDTQELRKAFRAPPRSDGTMFPIFKLFEVIKKFEEGSIKTWIQLVSELGVERKQDQSSQKLQQYAVRLKRWMRAMHVDAFFEYCLNKHHVYYDNIPLHLPTLEDDLRDGVPLEEDLALRALLPEHRPKRGRRKVERNISNSSFLGPEKRARQLLLPSTVEGILSASESDLVRHDVNEHQYPRDDRSRDISNSHSESRMWPDILMTSPSPFFAAGASQAFGTINSILENDQSFRSPSKYVEQEGHHNDFQRERPGATMSYFPAVKRARRSHGPAVSSAWAPSGTPRGVGRRGRPAMSRGAVDHLRSSFPATPEDIEVNLHVGAMSVPMQHDLSSASTVLEQELQFSTDAHQPTLPPIVNPLEDPAYDHDIVIAPLMDDRDDMRNGLQQPSLNPYHILDKAGMIKEQLGNQFRLPGTTTDTTEGNVLGRIANSLVDIVTEESRDKGIEDEALRSLSVLLGLDIVDMQSLVITRNLDDFGRVDTSDAQQLHVEEMELLERYRSQEVEDHGISDLIITDDTASSPRTIQASLEDGAQKLQDSFGSPSTIESYSLAWKLKLGPIEASLTATIPLSEAQGSTIPTTDEHHQPRREQRLRDEMDILFSDMETANASPGSYPGGGSDLLLNDDVEPALGGSIDWETKYYDAAARLKKVEADLARLKQDLIARVMA